MMGFFIMDDSVSITSRPFIPLPDQLLLPRQRTVYGVVSTYILRGEDGSEDLLAKKDD